MKATTGNSPDLDSASLRNDPSSKQYHLTWVFEVNEKLNAAITQMNFHLQTDGRSSTCCTPLT